MHFTDLTADSVLAIFAEVSLPTVYGTVPLVCQAWRSLQPLACTSIRSLTLCVGPRMTSANMPLLRYHHLQDRSGQQPLELDHSVVYIHQPNPDHLTALFPRLKQLTLIITSSIAALDPEHFGQLFKFWSHSLLDLSIYFAKLTAIGEYGKVHDFSVALFDQLKHLARLEHLTVYPLCSYLRDVAGFKDVLVRLRSLTIFPLLFPSQILPSIFAQLKSNTNFRSLALGDSYTCPMLLIIARKYGAQLCQSLVQLRAEWFAPSEVDVLAKFPALQMLELHFECSREFDETFHLAALVKVLCKLKNLYSLKLHLNERWPTWKEDISAPLLQLSTITTLLLRLSTDSGHGVLEERLPVTALCPNLTTIHIEFESGNCVICLTDQKECIHLLLKPLAKCSKLKKIYITANGLEKPLVKWPL